ncbi:MAG: substrate-binding domain-containing protein [Myxococcota bacterium]
MTRPRVIALLMNDAGLGDYYQGELRRGAERVCREKGIVLWVYGGRVDWTPAGSIQRQVFDLVHPSRIDGIVLAAGCIASYAPLDDVLQRLRDRCSAPICAVGGYCPDVPSLLIDNYSGAARVVDHLVREHGRRRFAYIAGPAGHEESDERLEGTRAALARYGLTLPANAVAHGNFAPYTGREITQRWLDEGISFDAIVSANDEMAVGALETLRAAGIDCPRQVALAGFDDSASARFCEPALTTVRQPVTALGAAAITLLSDLWDGCPPSELHKLQTDLVVRESCGCHAAPGSRVQGVGVDLLRSPEAELVELLTPVLDAESERESWAQKLLAAVAAERAGTRDALAQAFTGLLAALTLPQVHVEELQRAITALRARAAQQNPDDVPENAFHAARTLVSAHTSRTAGERNLQASWLLRELRRGYERLGTALTLGVLKEALAFQLPKLGVKNALVSLYSPGTLNSLEPLVCLENGVAVEVAEASYPSAQLIPESRLELGRCPSLTVLPLSFRLEQLGVVVLEIPLRLELYAILREQIGSAIKTVQYHQEVLTRQRQHAEAQEEKRATTERLKSLSVIAGGVAHDLNNVLGPLLALPQTIRQELERKGAGAVSAEVMEDLETIQEAGQRAAYTIHDLLALGRVDEIPKTSIDLNELLESERRTFLDVCRNTSRVSLRVTLSSEPLAVRGSRSHLLRAISNLVINAIDAIDRNGNIEVRACCRRVCERTPGATGIEPGDYAVIEVEDNGAGIPKDRLAHIFEPFFSAKRGSGTPGTGLGLAIVRRIVQDCGGYVHVESAIGRGTIFSLFFPRQAEAIAPERRSVQERIRFTPPCSECGVSGQADAHDEERSVA